ncbi:hypothetical protein I79_010337 [Cricetulus griseus]|uniref:Uncharacterized protein n=1 Tax=Cricetulus griseus TaxID=10029 RepID=G3HI70_CRIGR|nr:hypothetical protein I79_010337 [Cricetulus griseus]
MAQQVEGLATKPDKLSLILEVIWWKERTNFVGSLTSTHEYKNKARISTLLVVEPVFTVGN